MAAPQGLLSKPASRYTNTTFNRNFIKNQLQQQMTQSLLTEASGFKPDVNEASEKLNKLGIHGADRDRALSNILEFSKDFNDSVRENPFNAFTRENRANLTEISRELNNPQFGAFAERKLADDAVMDRADKDGLTDKIQIDKNLVKVVSMETRASNWITLDAWQKNPEKYQALTVGKDYAYTSGKLGAGRSNPFSVNMRSTEDVRKTIDDVLNKVGSDKTSIYTSKDDFIEKTTSSGNINQLLAGVNYLKQFGLNQTDINTLVSDELSKNPTLSYDDAYKTAMTGIFKRAESKIESENKAQPTKNVGAGGGGSGGGSGGVGGAAKTTLAHRLLRGAEQNYLWTFKPSVGGIGENKQAYLYQAKASDVTDLFINNPKLIGPNSVISKDDNGNVDYSRKIVDNPALMRTVSSALASNQAYYIAERDYPEQGISQGDLVNMTKDMFSNSYVYTNEGNRMVVVNHPYSVKTGQPASLRMMERITAYQKNSAANPALPIPTEIAEYFTAATSKGGVTGKTIFTKPSLSFTAATQISDNDLVSDNTAKLYNNTVGVANDTTDPATTQRVYDYSIQYAGVDPGGFFNFDDDIALPTVIIPINDPESLGIMVGDGFSYTAKSNLESQSSDDYFGTTPFFIPDDYKAVNQVIDAGYDTFPTQ